MSLITRQMYAQALQEKREVEDLIAGGDSSAKLTAMLNGISKRISKLSKEISNAEAADAAAEAAKEAKRAADAAKREAEAEHRDHDHGRRERPHRNRFEDRTLACADCKGDFVFSGKDQAFFAKNDYADPVRCTPCRQARRDARPVDVLINCSACHKDFTFTAGAQVHFKKMNWKAPSSCKPCRDAKRAKAEAASVRSGGSKKSAAAGAGNA